MKRIMLALAALPLLAAAPAERRYSVTDFDRIRIDGPYDVALTTGGSPGAKAVGDSPAALDGVSVEVQGRELRIRTNMSSSWGGYPGQGRSRGGVRLEVSAHELRGATLTGSGRLEVSRAKAQRFVLALSGSGSISIGRLDADALNLGAAGSGMVRIDAGGAKDAVVNVLGTAGLDAPNLVTDQLRLDSETAGNVWMSARTAAQVRTRGVGETIVTGTAACTVEQRGRGPVTCGEVR